MKEDHLKDLDPAKVKEFFDSLPDDSVVEGFDNFFVGGDAENQMNRGFKRVHNFQGMFHDDVGLEMEDDLNYFVPHIDVCGGDKAFEIFRENKKFVFDMFDFIETKSKELRYPVREEDLIVTEDDHCLIDYLVTLGLDSQTISSIAILSAYKEMGVVSAQFIDECGCPICMAFNRSIFVVREVLSVLCEGRQLVHAGCSCRWVPVIDRKEKYRFDSKTVDSESTVRLNIPVELYQDIKEIRDNNFMKFVYIGDVIEDEGFDFSLGFPVVFRDKEGQLLVHNGYIDDFNSVDFLKKFVEESEDFKEDSISDIFMYQGKKVILKEGLYYDLETGEVV